MFDVYPRHDIEFVRAEDVWVWDAAGRRYLDCYGGHAVISIGHAEPSFTQRVTAQLARVPFYSNAFANSLQEEYAAVLAAASGYPEHRLFLCNTGAEANENALKLASFHTGRHAVLAVRGAFHGRSSGAIAVTDNPAIQAPYNTGHAVVFVPLNDVDTLRAAFATHRFAAAIIEGIQGVAGIREPEVDFLTELRALCDHTGTMLIVDEVQSGCARSGDFFAHHRAGIAADLVTMGKGMGNGIPVGGVLITPRITAIAGMLGTTFGGGQLACTAAIAVGEVIASRSLAENAARVGTVLRTALADIPGVTAVRGRGLMLGIDTDVPARQLRAALLEDHGVITGGAGPATVRILPPLTFSTAHADTLAAALRTAISEIHDHTHSIGRHA
jgi:acetylornithine aminotransferase